MDMKTTDAKGRALTVKEMDPADQLDLFEACAKNSGNSAWVGMALLVCSVTMIDGLPVLMPRNPDEVKALARRLGTEGITAVAKALETPNAEVSEVVEVAKN